MVSNTAEAVLRSRYEDGITKGLQQSLRGMQQALAVMNSASSQAQGGFHRLRDSIQGAASAARNLIAPVSAALAAGAFGALKLAGNMETAEIGFRNMLGSAEAAQKLLGELQQFAAKTPFEFTGLVETSNRMLALGFASKDLLPTLKAVGDTAAALGGEKEKIDRIITALGQMRMKGKVSAEEMMQLAEAGVPVYDLLAKKIGVSIPQAMKLAEKGAIDANAAVNAIVQGMNERFGGRMEDMSRTLKGQFSNLVDSIKITGTVIGTAFLPDATKAVAKANELLEWAKNSAAAFVKLPEPIRNTAYAIAFLAAVCTAASIGVTGVNAGLKNLEKLVAPLAAAGKTISTVAYAIAHDLTGALVGAELALYYALPVIAAVGVGFAGWWLGDKLQKHAQANRELNDTTKFVKELNNRLKETPEWYISRGLAPPPQKDSASRPEVDKLLSFVRGLKPGATPPPILKPDEDEIKKQAERVASEQARLLDITREMFLRTADERTAAIVKLREDYRKIDELTTTKPDQRSIAKRYALEAYLQTVRDLNQKERDEQARHQELLAEIESEGRRERSRRMSAFINEMYLAPALAAYEAEREAAEEGRRREQQRSNEVSGSLGASAQLERAIALSQQGRIGRDIGAEAFSRVPGMIDDLQRKIAQLHSMEVLNPEQVDQLFSLYEALDRLNQLDMTPMKAMLGDLRESLHRMAAATTEAFATFWADMISGQENAGKRFLAALLNMVSNELMIRALRLTSLAVEHAAMLDFAGAARYAAAAAAVAALGGVLKGIAANLTQAGKQQAQSPQQGSSRSAGPQQIQVVQVGAPGRAQNPQSAARQQTVKVEVEVKAERGFVANEIKREIRGNGHLRELLYKTV